MPSPRKRIGFLPRTEVQCLIDQICIHNKLSQSKVTGILVEEALCNRGVLNYSYNKLSFDFDNKINNSSAAYENDSNSNKDIQNNNLDFGGRCINEDVLMINEFIEYKLFKTIMNQNNNSSTK